MNSNEVRSLMFGVVGLCAVAFWYFARPTASHAPTEIESPEPAPLEIAVEPYVPPAEPVEPVRDPIERVREPIEVAVDQPVPVPVEEPTPTETAKPQAPVDPMAVYSGTHKLGVNRVTDMARVGKVKFSKRDGRLHLEGRVQRGPHWLSISGNVEPDGPQQFTLNGTIKGVPDMAWKGEAPTERSTTGRFTFRVTKNRPYWRLYEVNGTDCVCWDNCGNDFCYIDIDRQAVP